MAVTKHTDLIAWQLCHQLRALVLRHTRTGEVARDYDFRRQLRKSARSACYLTSEGFYRYRRREMSIYMDWARASLGEALDQLSEGADLNYFKPDDYLTMRRLCLRAIKCNRTLKRSWGNRPAPGTENRRPPKPPPALNRHPTPPRPRRAP